MSKNDLNTGIFWGKSMGIGDFDNTTGILGQKNPKYSNFGVKKHITCHSNPAGSRNRGRRTTCRKQKHFGEDSGGFGGGEDGGGAGNGFWGEKKRNRGPT